MYGNESSATKAGAVAANSSPRTMANKRHLYEQMSTLRDALVAALTLDTFNRNAE